tara:strand:- start:5187 stop:5831 length:645 start_codon:yes stop_codon:yes gene_type:complete
MKNESLSKERMKILKKLKKDIISNGWNENLFKKKQSFNENQKKILKSLFPKGYKSLLIFYLSNADNEMIKASKTLNLVKMRTHEKIYNLVLLKLKINQKDKELIKRTFYTLLLPHFSRLLASSTYNTVNLIWDIAGDNSKDYNFYSKRLILASIYSATIFYWLNDKTLQQTKYFLNEKLEKVSKIPKLKKNIDVVLNKYSNINSFIKNVLNIKQ